MFKVLIVATLALALVGCAQASAASTKPLWHTDAQVEKHMETQFNRWAGIDLTKADYKSAFCVNGYYSAYEKKHPKNYGERVNRYGENLFRSFSCSLSADGRSFELYVRHFPTGWLVIADR